MSTELEHHPLEDLTLFSGVSEGFKILILVTGKRMAVSTDFGPTDPWRNKLVNSHFVFEPLDLSEYTDLEKVW